MVQRIVLPSNVPVNDLAMTGNIVCSNTLTTTNIFTINLFATGNIFIQGGQLGTTLGVTGNAYVSNAITTSKLFANNVGISGFIVSGNIHASNAISTGNLFGSGYMTIAGVQLDSYNMSITGNAYVSNAITTANVFPNVVRVSSFITGSSIVVVGNLTASNTLTTTNIYVSNILASGNLTVTGSCTVTGNAYVANAVTASNVWLTDSVYASNVFSSQNVYSANSVTTANVWTTNVDATGSLTITRTSVITGNIFSANLFTNNLFSNIVSSGILTVTGDNTVGYTTLRASNMSSSNALTTQNVFTSNITSLGVGTFSAIDVTGNAYVSNAVTTTNVFSNAIVFGFVTCTGGAPGLPTTGQTTLVSSNLTASNSLVVSNVFSTGGLGLGSVRFTPGGGSPLEYNTSMVAANNTFVSNTITVNNAWLSSNVYAQKTIQVNTLRIYQDTTSGGLFTQSLTRRTKLPVYREQTYAPTNPGGIPTTQTFTVTVVNPGIGNVFYVDGVNRPALTLLRGGVYTFNQANASNSGHPIAFKIDGGSSYTTGVVSSGTPGTGGAQTVFTVDPSAPAQLRYYCTVHGDFMGSTISIAEAPTGVFNGDEYYGTTTLALNKFIGGTWRTIGYPVLTTPVITQLSTQTMTADTSVSVGVFLNSPVVIPVVQTASSASVGQITWSISGQPSNVYLTNQQSTGCSVVVPAGICPTSGTFNTTVTAQNRSASATMTFGIIIPVNVAAGLYPFTTATFGTDTFGTSGPNLSQAKSYISGTPTPSNWYNTGSNLTMPTNGIMSWTVPSTASYTITVAGARGGSYYASGGNGRIINATITLTQNQIIKILVGSIGGYQYATENSGMAVTGGGGGTFVVDNNNNPLIIAGGGGGGTYVGNGSYGGAYTGFNASDFNVTSGQQGGSAQSWDGAGGAGGTSGYGGARGGNNYGGPGGSGFIGNGGEGGNYGGYAGTSFLNGGLGGNNKNPSPYGANVTVNSVGGFGGGGGVVIHPNFEINAAGGGGYSGGGGGGTRNCPGGGGGNYISGSGVSSVSNGGLNGGQGYVTITKL